MAAGSMILLRTSRCGRGVERSNSQSAQADANVGSFLRHFRFLVIGLADSTGQCCCLSASLPSASSLIRLRSHFYRFLLASPFFLTLISVQFAASDFQCQCLTSLSSPRQSLSGPELPIANLLMLDWASFYFASNADILEHGVPKWAC